MDSDVFQNRAGMVLADCTFTRLAPVFVQSWYNLYQFVLMRIVVAPLFRESNLAAKAVDLVLIGMFLLWLDSR